MIWVKNNPPSVVSVWWKECGNCSTALRSTGSLHISFAASLQHSPDIPAGAFSKDQALPESPPCVELRKAFCNGNSCLKHATHFPVKYEANLAGKLSYFLHKVSPFSLVFH